MMPLAHIIFGFLFSLTAYFLFDLKLDAFFVLFFSTWIFDLEFPLRYAPTHITKIRQQGIKKIYAYFLEKRKRISKMPKAQKFQILICNKPLLFHSIEIIIGISILLFFLLKPNNLIYLWCFLAGICFHLFLDIIEGVSIKEKFSLILFHIARKRIEKRKEQQE